jgi:hypothetical protein
MILISYPHLCRDFLIFEFSNIHTCRGCQVIFEIFVYTRTIKTWVTDFPIINLSICSTIFIYLFILSFMGVGGLKGSKRLKRATTLKRSSGHIQPRKY